MRYPTHKIEEAKAGARQVRDKRRTTWTADEGQTPYRRRARDKHRTASDCFCLGRGTHTVPPNVLGFRLSARDKHRTARGARDKHRTAHERGTNTVPLGRQGHTPYDGKERGTNTVPLLVLTCPRGRGTNTVPPPAGEGQTPYRRRTKARDKHRTAISESLALNFLCLGTRRGLPCPSQELLRPVMPNT